MTITVPMTVSAEVKGDLAPGEDAAYFAEIVTEHVQRILRHHGVLLSEGLAFHEDRTWHDRWAIHWRKVEVSAEVKHE